MRGEEKPYEMPAPEQDQPPAIAPPAAVAASVAASKASETKQKISRQFTNNLAIQQRLQHLSPVHPQTLTVETSSGSAASQPLAAGVAASLTSIDLHKSPSAASTATPVLTSSSPVPASASTLLMTTHHHHHPLDSLLTPAASPEEDPLETWIHTV